MTRGQRFAVLSVIACVLTAAVGASAWVSAAGKPEYTLLLVVVTAAVVFFGSGLTEQSAATSDTEGR